MQHPLDPEATQAPLRSLQGVEVYLAATPRLRGVAEGRPGELVIDWTRDFLGDDPEPEAWKWKLIPDLERHLATFRRDRKNLIRLRAFARNSVGLAFGYVFCQRAGFQIHFEDSRGEIWRTDEPVSVGSPLTRTNTVLSPLASDIVLELAITQEAHSVTGPVDSWLQRRSQAAAPAGTSSPGPYNLGAWRDLLDAHFSEGDLRDLCFDLGIDYESLPGEGKRARARELVAYADRRARGAELLAACRRLRAHLDWDSLRLPGPAGLAQDAGVRKRVLLTLEREPPMITPAEGAAVARQICDLVSREGQPGGTVHLFGALPLGVLVLAGWGLKAGRTIQFYDLNQQGQYQPTCLLKP